MPVTAIVLIGMPNPIFNKISREATKQELDKVLNMYKHLLSIERSSSESGIDISPIFKQTIYAIILITIDYLCQVPENSFTNSGFMGFDEINYA